jgi:hypothetical protein
MIKVEFLLLSLFQRTDVLQSEAWAIEEDDIVQKI